MRKFISLILLCGYGFAAFDFSSITADFTQTVTSEEASVNYEGNFYARDDNRALWIYAKPTPKKIYFDSDKVVVVEDELEQAVISKLENTPNITKLLKSAKRIKDTLYKTEFDDVEYLVTTDGDLPKRIDYQDKLGNKIKIVFQNVKKDVTIDEATLTPIIPSFYDVIRQ